MTAQSMEVKNWDCVEQIFTLWLPMPNAIQIGDTYSVYPGCNKQICDLQQHIFQRREFRRIPLCAGRGQYFAISDMIDHNKNMIAAARACLGTPFHHQGRMPGVGLDCIGLVIVALARCGYVCA